MGQNYLINNKFNEIEIDNELNKSINQELNKGKYKKHEKKVKNLIGRNIGKELLPSNFNENFNRNKNGIKNISNLLNFIYDNNINRDQISKANRSIYEVLFDVRDSKELIIDNKISNLNNKIDNNKINTKINNTRESIIIPKSIITSNNIYNYGNDINKNETNVYLNNFPKVTKIYPTKSFNVNNRIIQKENIYINKPNKSELILPNNYEHINETSNFNNINLRNYMIFENPNQNQLNNIQTINNINSTYLYNQNPPNNLNYQEINQYNNIEHINNKKVNNYFILDNKNNNKDIYIIENDLPKKIINNEINPQPFYSVKVNEPNQYNSKNCKEENTHYIYNKKNNIKKQSPPKDKQVKTKINLEINTHKHNKSFDIKDLKKKSEVMINYSEKKQTKKNKIFQNEEIVKNQEIFIEKSPIKDKIQNFEILKKHQKNLYSEQITNNYFTIINHKNDDILSKQSEYSLNNSKDEESQENEILNQDKSEWKKSNINKINKIKNNVKIKPKESIKPSKNKKPTTHSKKSKKQPVVNIQIDLKDLIKLETMDKSNKTKKSLERKQKKSKILYDYPEDLKYNVFGKQYKFSYKDK